MKRSSFWSSCAAAVIVSSQCSALLAQQNPASAPVRAVRPAQTIVEKSLDTAAGEGKFAFIVFRRDDGPAAQTLTKSIQDGLGTRAEQAAIIQASIADPANKAVVDRFAVARAAMPMALVVAPNGAITGVFSKTPDANLIEASFATPTMTKCMKSMQEGKLVLVNVQPHSKAGTPRAISDFQADPMYKDRVVTVSMVASDSAEGKFMKQMQLEPGRLLSPTIVFLAPPGVMVGKFDGSATKDQLAGALHQAGKCCDDPNCKHGQPAASPRSANQPAQPRR